jgi:hypothetical protein
MRWQSFKCRRIKSLRQMSNNFCGARPHPVRSASPIRHYIRRRESIHHGRIHDPSSPIWCSLQSEAGIWSTSESGPGPHRAARLTGHTSAPSRQSGVNPRHVGRITSLRFLASSQAQGVGLLTLMVWANHLCAADWLCQPSWFMTTQPLPVSCGGSATAKRT